MGFTEKRGFRTASFANNKNSLTPCEPSSLIPSWCTNKPQWMLLLPPLKPPTVLTLGNLLLTTINQKACDVVSRIIWWLHPIKESGACGGIFILVWSLGSCCHEKCHCVYSWELLDRQQERDLRRKVVGFTSSGGSRMLRLRCSHSLIFLFSSQYDI